MIENLRLLHYLEQPTYQEICGLLGLSGAESKTGGNWAHFADSAISRIHLFNIEYRTFGRIWFMHVDVGFRRLQCSYGDCPAALYREYQALLGETVMARFPDAEQANCDYIEYTARLRVDDADAAVDALRATLAPEQLDRSLWPSYSKAPSTVALLLCKGDDTHLEMLTRCHGTAMKRILKDKALHRATGVSLAAAANWQTERLVIGRQTDRYIRPAVSVELEDSHPLAHMEGQPCAKS